MRNKVIFLGLLSILGMMFIPTSDAVLWDLLIQTNIDTSNQDAPIISGIITDHASKPVKDVQVSIRTGHDSAIVHTDESGKFRLELSNIKRMTGNYLVDIVASTADGKIGYTNTEFQIIGEFTKTSIIEGKLSTQEAIKYLYADPNSFEKDPIGFILYNHYQKLLQEYYDTINEKMPEYQKYFDEQTVEKTPTAENPTWSIFTGETYEEYVNSLEPTIRETVVNQLNITINIFDEANQIKNSVLENGGTEDEAKSAYLEYIAISKETLENFVYNAGTSNDSTEQLQNVQITSNGENIIIQSDMAGIKIKIGGDGTIFGANVNGTIAEFFVDENKNIQINNFEN
ncbi:MAG: carboxypeptidase-like regulatory domain-containing protein [Nitrosarchaeum sp.]